MTKPDDILKEAQSLITGDRKGTYGDAYEDFTRAAAIVGMVRPNVNITADDIPYIMIAIKLSRQAFYPKRDNLVDLVGYASLAQYVEERSKCDENNSPIGSEA
jgi:hypothetical protein